MGHVPPERWSPMRRRRTAIPPNGWPQDGGTAPLPWVPDPRIPADDVAAPRRSRPVPEPEPAPRRPWRREQPDRPGPVGPVGPVGPEASERDGWSGWSRPP